MQIGRPGSCDYSGDGQTEPRSCRGLLAQREEDTGAHNVRAAGSQVLTPRRPSGGLVLVSSINP